MQEFVDFLGKHGPFDALSGTDLERIARRVETEYFPKGALIPEADPGQKLLRVIRKGAVNVVEEGRVVDELVVGDSFGPSSLWSGVTPAVSMIAAENTVCYRIPDPWDFLESPERSTFAHFGTRVDHSRTPFAAGSVADFLRPALECSAGTRVRDAARLMSDNGLSYILVRSRDGLGIVTDSDCRSKVVTGQVPLDATVDAIATIPAMTVSGEASAGAAFLEMVQHGVHHLVVVAPDGATRGVVRVVDLSSADIRDPLMVRSAVRSAGDVDELARAVGLLGPTLANLYDAAITPLRIGALHSAIIDAVLERLVSFHPDFGASSPYATSWLVLGSLARREPLPLSDVDTGLVWKPRSPDEPVDPDALLASAERVIADLERCGLRRCPDGANAGNPLFNRSLDAWTASAHRWRQHPDGPGALLLSSMIADSRPMTGFALGKSLSAELSAGAHSKQFLHLMLRSALTHRPPTGFVRDFVVEHGGRHRGELDLKKGGLLPVVSIARWIGLATSDTSGSTLDRLRRGHEAGLLTADEGDVLGRAFEGMYHLLFDRELESQRSASPPSTYLAPGELDTLTRRHLRESFRAIARVQSRLENEWESRLS